MRKIVFLFFLSFLIGCGGGGGGSSVTSQSLPGTYVLTGFTAITNIGETITEKDAPPGSWSGSMDIGNTEIGIRLTLDGESDNFTGLYSATWTSPTTGTIFDGYDTIDFTYNGADFTWIYYDYQIDVGLTADMYIHWRKTSDSHVNLSIKGESIPNNDNRLPESVFSNISSILLKITQ